MSPSSRRGLLSCGVEFLTKTSSKKPHNEECSVSASGEPTLHDDYIIILILLTILQIILLILQAEDVDVFRVKLRTDMIQARRGSGFGAYYYYHYYY